MLRIPANLGEAKKEVKDRIKDHGNGKKKPFGETFAIVVEGNFAGYVDLHHLNLEHHEHKGEIGYAIHPDYRGKGLASKAVKLVADYAFKQYKLKRLSAMGGQIIRPLQEF
jgi:RimJ/RimL family protein N-acetyltransferase